MKKTHRVNISGMIYNIDDDAYTLLNDYLDSIKSRFKSEEESNEILADVEARIAELFQERISVGKEVINIEDVNYVIGIMGTPNDFTASDDDQTTENETYTTKSRRVYRDADDRLLGGVSSGLGHYFNINPWILRIAFIALSFTITGLVLYALLWFVLPEAKTTAEKLEMKGEKVNLSNIQKSIRHEIDSVSNTVRQLSKSPKWQQTLFGIRDFLDKFFLFLLKLLRIIAIPFGLFFVLAGIFGISSLIGSFFFSDSFFAPTSWNTNTFHLDRMLFLLDSPAKVIFTLVFGMITASVPLLLIIFLGTKMIVKYKSSNKRILKWAGSIWLVSVLIFGVSVWSIAFNYKNQGFNEKTEYIKTSPETIRIAMQADTEFMNKSKNSFTELHDNMIIANKSNKMFIRPLLDIKKSDDSTIRIKFVAKSQGRDLMEAEINSKRMIYNYKMQDTVIFFNPYFDLGDGAKYRGQDLFIELYIPIGQIVYIDKNIQPILCYDIDNMEDAWRENLVGDYWIMTQNGLSRYAKSDIEVALAHPYDSEHPGGGQNAITNGKTASEDVNDPNWQGFKNRNFEAIFDLKELSSVEQISTRFLNMPERCIYQPEYVEYYMSDDGVNFTLLNKEISTASEIQDNKVRIRTFTTQINKQARYIKVYAKAVDKCQNQEYEPVWLFTDEIVVDKKTVVSDAKVEQNKKSNK